MVAPFSNGRLTRSYVRIPGSGNGGNGVSAYQDFSQVSTTAAIMAAQQPPPPAALRPLQSRISSSDVRKMHADTHSPISEGVNRGETPASRSLRMPSSSLGERVARSGAFGASRPVAETAANAFTNMEIGRGNSFGVEIGGGSSMGVEIGNNSSMGTETSDNTLSTMETLGGNTSPRREGKRPRRTSDTEPTGPQPAKAPRIMYMALPQMASVHVAGPASPQSELPSVPQGSQVVMVPAGPAFMMNRDLMQQLMSERNQLRQQNVALEQRVRAFQQLFRNKNRLTSVLRTLGITVA